MELSFTTCVEDWDGDRYESIEFLVSLFGQAVRQGIKHILRYHKPIFLVLVGNRF